MTDPLTEAVARAIHAAHMIEKGPLAAWTWEEAAKPYYVGFAKAAIAALREHMRPSPDTPPVAKSESPVVSDTAAQLAEAQREIERKEWKP